MSGSRAPSKAAAQAIAYARQQLGKPYLWGATGPDAFDCSGLVMEAYVSAGVRIARTSQAQWVTEPHVPASRVQPGDLVFFAGADGTMTSPGHVGIVIGHGDMIEAYGTGYPIRYASYDRPDLVGFTDPGAGREGRADHRHRRLAGGHPGVGMAIGADDRPGRAAAPDLAASGRVVRDARRGADRERLGAVRRGRVHLLRLPARGRVAATAPYGRCVMARYRRRLTRDQKLVVSAVAVGVLLAAGHDEGGLVHSATAASTGSGSSNEQLANSMAASGYGWTGSQTTCLDELWTEESGFSAYAANPASNARGIPQNINGWSASYQPGNARQQIAWGLEYISGRYGSPCAAWAFERSHTPNWY